MCGGHRGWREVSAYQQILPLRTNNADGTVFLIEGMGADQRATISLSSG
jgi:hypothetical protein